MRAFEQRCSLFILPEGNATPPPRPTLHGFCCPRYAVFLRFSAVTFAALLLRIYNPLPPGPSLSPPAPPSSSSPTRRRQKGFPVASLSSRLPRPPYSSSSSSSLLCVRVRGVSMDRRKKETLAPCWWTRGDFCCEHSRPEHTAFSSVIRWRTRLRRPLEERLYRTSSSTVAAADRIVYAMDSKNKGEFTRYVVDDPPVVRSWD